MLDAKDEAVCGFANAAIRKTEKLPPPARHAARRGPRAVSAPPPSGSPGLPRRPGSRLPLRRRNRKCPYPPPDPFGGKPRRKRNGAEKLARFAGTLLCVLLPVLTLALSWAQRETLLSALPPLILGEDGPAWLAWGIWGAFTLAGAFLSLLPGLWTLLLNRRNR